MAGALPATYRAPSWFFPLSPPFLEISYIEFTQLLDADARVESGRECPPVFPYREPIGMKIRHIFELIHSNFNQHESEYLTRIPISNGNRIVLEYVKRVAET